jgi:hypothetical protein
VKGKVKKMRNFKTFMATLIAIGMIAVAVGDTAHARPQQNNSGGGQSNNGGGDPLVGNGGNENAGGGNGGNENAGGGNSGNENAGGGNSGNENPGGGNANANEKANENANENALANSNGNGLGQEPVTDPGSDNPPQAQPITFTLSSGGTGSSAVHVSTVRSVRSQCNTIQRHYVGQPVSAVEPAEAQAFYRENCMDVQ